VFAQCRLPRSWASLAMDRAGNLYGTTVCEGANNVGTVFKLTPSGNSWTYTDLHDFTGAPTAHARSVA
jgi:uncharacterized repeat protein (TIGR03803 family)